jgi:hypothetical protein
MLALALVIALVVRPRSTGLRPDAIAAGSGALDDYAAARPEALTAAATASTSARSLSA